MTKQTQVRFKSRHVLTPLLAALALSACGGSDNDLQPSSAEAARPQDSRTFAPVVPTLNALANPAGATVAPDTDRWVGVNKGASYAIEVPKNWNGMLVMYAHGYAGTGPNLIAQTPAIRRHLISQGYAWAASSYSKNYYDVRAGVEDTNALALAFNDIARANGRALPAPSKTYIIGHSMGGHIAAAAVDEENIRTANNKVRYAGAVPMCGVLGDTELFDYFTAYQIAAQKEAGVPATSWPVTNWAEIAAGHQQAVLELPDSDYADRSRGADGTGSATENHRAEPDRRRPPAVRCRLCRSAAIHRMGHLRQRRHHHRHPERARRDRREHRVPAR